eukprot:scaffold469_cov160-Amphora_coffeaeformis.AAC.5
MATTPLISPGPAAPAKKRATTTKSTATKKAAKTVIKPPPSEPTENHKYYRVFRQGTLQNPEEICLGFLSLSVDATFATARQTIEEELELDGMGAWGFILEPLGPVSPKQEGKLGRILDWILADDDGDTELDLGTRAKPIKLVIADK